jgi:hypothetical protein
MCSLFVLSVDATGFNYMRNSFSEFRKLLSSQKRDFGGVRCRKLKVLLPIRNLSGFCHNQIIGSREKLKGSYYGFLSEEVLKEALTRGNMFKATISTCFENLSRFHYVLAS